MKTNTTRFILAMIFNNEITCDKILKDHYIDSYTSDYYEPENDGCIIVIKTIDEEPYGTLHSPIRKYERDGRYLFVYEIPLEYKKDYSYILKGDFDSVSTEYKKKLAEFWQEEEDSEFLNLLYTNDIINRKIYKYCVYENMYRCRPSVEDYE